MKSKNLIIIDLYRKTSFLFWFGVFELIACICCLFSQGFDAAFLETFLYPILDIVTAVCATTKNKFTEKNIKINIIATSVRIAFSTFLSIVAILDGDMVFILMVIFIPIINVLYLILTIIIKKVAMVSNDKAGMQSIKKQNALKKSDTSQEPELPERYLLVKDDVKLFANWKDRCNFEYFIYAMPHKTYDGVYVVEIAVKNIYRYRNFSKKHLNYYSFDHFVREILGLIESVDWFFDRDVRELAKEIWDYLNCLAQSYDGEVSPDYQERYFQEVQIDGNFENSNGEAKLYYLGIGHILDKPVMRWKISWNSTGSHVDYASDTVVIDDETIKNPTVESLIEWMKKNLSNIFDLCNPNEYFEDERLLAWCEAKSKNAGSKAEQGGNKKTVSISVDSVELGADVIEKINQYRENKSDDTYNALMSVIKNSLFMCPFLYDEEVFGKPVSDNAIHFNYDTKKLVESVIDSTSFDGFLEEKEINGNISFNPTIVITDGRKLHINNAESYIFSKEASSQTMHYLTVANNGKQFIPLFTDIEILRKIFGNAARICIVDYAAALEASKMDIIDYNGNKVKIDAIVINPSQESFVV